MSECTWPNSDLMKKYHENEWCRINKMMITSLRCYH